MPPKIVGIQRQQEAGVGDPRPSHEHASGSGQGNANGHQANREDSSMVVIGFVSCRLSPEIYVVRQLVIRTGQAWMDQEQVKARNNQEAHEKPMVKWARLISSEGREIIGPGYSVCNCFVGQESGRKGRPGWHHLECSTVCGWGDNYKEKGPRGRHEQDMEEATGPNLNLGHGEPHDMANADKLRLPAPRWCPAGLTRLSIVSYKR
jgi:hypothetical protein